MLLDVTSRGVPRRTEEKRRESSVSIACLRDERKSFALPRNNQCAKRKVQFQKNALCLMGRKEKNKKITRFLGNLLLKLFESGDRGGTMVKVLCYKSEGRWFDPRWCHCNFSLT